MPFAPQQSTRRLTQEENNSLRVNSIMPVIIMALASMVMIVMLIAVVWPLWDRPFVKWFGGIGAVMLGAMVVAVWMHVRNNLGDLRDGVAQVRSGRVLAKRRTGRAPYTFYATIDGTGELIVWGADYEKMIEQQSYIVAFSPRTRRVWTVEPVTTPFK